MSFDSATHRAAVLIKCLPQATASKLLARLDADDLRVVFERIRNLGQISHRQRQLAASRFVKEVSAGESKSRLQRQSSDASPFSFLAETSSDIRNRILVGEHPQIVATVLSFLPTSIASESLNSLEPETRVTVLRRMCQIDSFEEKEVANIAFQLKSRLNRLLNSDRMRQGGMRAAEKLISCSDSVTQESLFEAIGQQDPELGEQLRREIFRFDDLRSFTDVDIKTLLRFVDTSVWAPALRNCDAQMQRKILGNLAARPRQILQRELDAIESMDTHVAQQAQSHVVDVCVSLAEKHQIRLPVAAPPVAVPSVMANVPV